MANREVTDHYPRRRHARGEELLRVDRLDGGGLKEISFVLHRGEILGIAGLRRRRPHAAGARDRRARIRSARETDRRSRQRRCASTRRPTAVRAGIGFLPEDRKQQGLVLPLSVERNISMSAPLRAGPLRGRQCARRNAARPMRRSRACGSARRDPISSCST